MLAETPPALHRFATFVAVCVVGLIAAGGLVKSLEAGLSVPDWPTSYGGLNPPRWWEIENVRAEHGHRLIAGTVAMLTALLAFWAWRREPRGWARRIAYAALVAVLIQALLGGLTVLFFLPIAISVSHAALAQLYLCLVVSFAVVTARGWRALEPSPAEAATAGRLRGLVTGTTLAIYCQILIGALVRHSGAGLAIPDFPTMFGRWWPPSIDGPVALHLGHRVGALAVTLLIVWVAVATWRSRAQARGLLLPVTVICALVVLQITLGANIIWSARAVLPNTLHVPTGACLLAAAWMLSLRTWRIAWLGERR